MYPLNQEQPNQPNLQSQPQAKLSPHSQQKIHPKVVQKQSLQKMLSSPNAPHTVNSHPRSNLSHNHNIYNSIQSIRLNADNSRPRDILCFWLVFTAVIGGTCLLAIFVAPKEIMVKSNQTELKNSLNHGCMNPSGFLTDTRPGADNKTQVLECNKFGEDNPYLGLLLRDVNELNQFALISLQYQQQTSPDPNQELPPSQQPSKTTHQLQQNITITLYSIQLVQKPINPSDPNSKTMGEFTKQQKLAERTLHLQDKYQNQTFVFYGQKITHFIGFYREFSRADTNNYLLLIHFSNATQIGKNQMRMELKGILFRKEFTVFVIVVRAACFAITLLTSCIYIYLYLKQKRTNTTKPIPQQKLVLIMSILILLFNDPTYILTVTSPSLTKYLISHIRRSIISVVFLSQFIAFIFFFWVFVAERIYSGSGGQGENEDGRGRQLNKSKIGRVKKLAYVVYFMSYFVVLSLFYSGIAKAVYEGNFIVHPQEIQPGLSFIYQMWLVINITIYLYIVITILQQGRAKLWRNISWIYFNIYFSLLLLIFIIISGSIYQQSSQLILIFYISLNLYCIYMQYMFSADFRQKKLEDLQIVNKFVRLEQNAEAEDRDDGEEGEVDIVMEDLGRKRFK